MVMSDEDVGKEVFQKHVERLKYRYAGMKRLREEEEEGWRCPDCGQKLIKEISDYDVYQCHNCGLAWRIMDAHPLTHVGEFP